MKSAKLASSLILATLLAAGGAVLTDRRASAREAGFEAEYPAHGQIVMVKGRAVHATILGQGPDLVLIHGASGNLRDFSEELMARLAADFRVIAFDRPGMGWSALGGDANLDPRGQAETLRAAAATLGVQRPLVLGHSYGGAVAMAWALQDPDTAGLIIASGATMPWPEDDGLGAWYAITSHPLGRALVVPMVTAFAPLSKVEATIESIFAPDPVPQGYAHRIGAGLSMRRAALGVNARQVTTLRPALVAMEPDYPGLTLPVELIHGDADTTVPLHIHAAQLVQRLPNANLTTLPGLGHMPHHSAPDAVIAAIHRAASRAGLIR